MKSRSQSTQRKTRIQQENHDRILEAALEIFSQHGFRGATIDQIAEQAGMSKPNLLYYFRRKEDVHRELIDRLLETWLAPLEEMNADGEPLNEIRAYLERKLEMARDYPRESRLFANEVLRGAPHIQEELNVQLKQLVEEKSKVLKEWMRQGKIAKCQPEHLLFSIWATTQHYADFDAQIKVILGEKKYGPGRFNDAAEYLDLLFLNGLKP